MAVAGSLGGGTLAFILPPLCAIVLSEDSVLFWRNRGRVCASMASLLPPVLLLIFGVIVIPLTVYETVTDSGESC